MKPIIELSKEEFFSKDNILRQVCTEVIHFDELFQDEVNDLIESFEAHPRSVGLSAPQIGIFKRFAIINPIKKTGDRNHIIVVNPKIIFQNEDLTDRVEGCLSLPHYEGKVSRRCDLKIAYQDRNGNYQEMEAKEFVGRIILHEIDHLDGILYTDRMDADSDLTWVEDWYEQKK